MESTTSIQTTTEPRPTPGGVAKLIRKVKKVSKRRFTADQKIKIVLEGFRKEIPVTELCRREKVSAAIYYKWLREHKIIPNRFNENDLKTMIDLRNMSAHIASKDVIPPTMVFPMLWRIFDFINCLFDPEEHLDEPEVIKKTRNFYKEISDVIDSEI